MVAKKSVALHVYWPSASLDTTPKEKSRNLKKWKSLEDQDKERKENCGSLRISSPRRGRMPRRRMEGKISKSCPLGKQCCQWCVEKSP